MKTCTGSNGIEDVNCSINTRGALGAGTDMPQKPDTAPPTEDVGLTGNKLNALPGNNPVRIYNP